LSESQTSVGQSEWQAAFVPAAPAASGQNTLPLMPVNDGFAGSLSAVAAIQRHLVRGPILIDFADTIAAGKTGAIAGLLFALVIGDSNVSADVSWAHVAVDTLAAWRFNGQWGTFVFDIADDGVTLTLAPPAS